MTKATRKKVITIETMQRTVIRQNAPQTQKMWCDFCQLEVEMSSPEIAAKIFQVSVREIYRRIERGEIHFFEAETSEVFICFNLLMRKVRGEK